MSKKWEAIFAGIGILAGLALSGPASAAVQQLTATPTNQTFYVDGQQVLFEAYHIHGNNFVKLRDIGKAVDFGVTYDAATNSVHIDSAQPYQEEVPAVPSAPTKESVQAVLAQLRETYPTGAEYPAPYRPNDPLNRPFSNCDHCAGWAMLCSDAAFGSLAWRKIADPKWENIRTGDVLAYRNEHSGHAIVVLKKTDEYVKVTESGLNNKVRWGGQYFKWWLEEQPGYALYTRYPE